MEKLLDFYTDYLISSTGQTSATGLSALLDNAVSHDRFTRFLANAEYESKTLWQSVKPLVRANESDMSCLVFDDCIIEKTYTDENDLIGWHWDHSKSRSVKGVNLLTAFYVTQKEEQSYVVRLPVGFELIKKTLTVIGKDNKERRKSEKTKNELMQSMVEQAIAKALKFKYILADSWFASTDNMHFIQEKKKYFVFDLKDNRLAVIGDGINSKPGKKSQWTNIKALIIPDNTSVVVWLKDMNFPVLLTKKVFKNEDDQTVGVQFLVTNDFRLTDDKSPAIYKKRWSVEEYHKSLKQNTGIAKSPTHTVKTQSNHLYCSIWAYVKLEKLKCSTKLGHFEIKSKIYLKALKAAYAELANIKNQAMAA